MRRTGRREGDRSQWRAIALPVLARIELFDLVGGMAEDPVDEYSLGCPMLLFLVVHGFGRLFVFVGGLAIEVERLAYAVSSDSDFPDRGRVEVNPGDAVCCHPRCPLKPARHASRFRKGRGCTCGCRAGCIWWPLRAARPRRLEMRRRVRRERKPLGLAPSTGRCRPGSPWGIHPTDSTGVTGYLTSPKSGNPTSMACTLFLAAADRLDQPCKSSPPGEVVRRVSDTLVEFDDPPGVVGNSAPSGGDYRAKGVMFYESGLPSGGTATCTLPDSSRQLCTVILSDFAKRTSGYAAE
jgi:hypothetical protein